VSTEAAEPADSKFEIGHVLFIDIVGYSKLLIEDQKERLRQLTEIVLATAQVREATDEQLVRLPTGDGMALVFRHSAEEPARCALEIAEALRKHPELPVRMGIHSGPVSEVTDVSGRTNIAGAGINLAQRVMDCGDAGHILVSKRVADDLEQYARWRSLLHELGECEVKHGLRISLLNLYSEEVGNPEAPERFRQVRAKDETGIVPRDEGFWVAVLPFKYSGSNSDLTALAEGLTEEIVTGLSRFSYLKVISRSSTSRYANESVDVRSAGKELGARYVMEGSLRSQAGTKLRLAVQLVDAVSGAHLWAETYERVFSPETIFELQDDLVPRIVSTVAEWYGVLPHSMSESLRSKGSDELSPYEAVLRSFGYYERLTAEEHATARAGLERAVQEVPAYADGWAMLSMIYGEEYKFGFNAGPDPLERALKAGRRAAEAAPSNHFAYLALAQTLFFRKELQTFRSAAGQALTLNPMDGYTIAYMGMLMSFAGDWERGRALVDRAMQFNPKHPGWYWFPAFWDTYRKSDYRGALKFALKINMPDFFWTHVVTAAAYGQLGERDAAGKALRELLFLKPDFAVNAREEPKKWFDPELVEHLMDGLRKAGLENAAAAEMRPRCGSVLSSSPTRTTRASSPSRKRSASCRKPRRNRENQ